MHTILYKTSRRCTNTNVCKCLYLHTRVFLFTIHYINNMYISPRVRRSRKHKQKHKYTHKRFSLTHTTTPTRKNKTRTTTTRYTIPEIPSSSLAPAGGTPKVALLFLTRDRHEQSALWDAFLNHTTHAVHYSVYCHPAFPEKIPQTSFLRSPHGSPSEGVIPASLRVPPPHTRWGHLVLAYYQLLHRAFNDTHNNNQRFVYLSETCVPCVNAKAAYTTLMRNLDATYMDAPKPKDNVDRYDQVMHYPWRSFWPWKVTPRYQQRRSMDCAVELCRTGIQKEHFFKHSGWFSPNREDAYRLLCNPDAFEALNVVNAGDEHILSILRSHVWAPPSKLKQHRITHVQWDYDKIQQWETLKKNEAYWKKDQHLKDTNPTLYAKFRKEREPLKNANMHPIEYTKLFSLDDLKQCMNAKSVFVRKVRQSCDVGVLFDRVREK